MSSKSIDDVWIPTTCEMCDAHCGILVHRVDGKAVGIRGNPDDENTLGKVCAKTFASLLMLEDPSRVNVPLRRTNPEKGIGIDPGWVEITWDEALDSIAERLGKIRAEDPRRLLCTWSLTAREPTDALPAFAKAFGTPNYFMGGSGPCGDAHRLTTLQRYACISPHPDPKYCNYLLNFGCGEGTGTYWDPMAMGQRIAEARIRGMRTVVIDPVFSAAAAKANEWIPIRPGADAMFALATLNVLLNELNIFDAGHIKKHTDGPYLVNEEGYYIRDEETTKPMVWDPVDKQAKPYDDPSLKDYSIEGKHKVNEAIGVPVFALLKEHVKKYSPEHASEMTTVPPNTIRRIAREFGEAASIGSTIKIDGKTLPLRPVATIYYKGAAAHLNALANCTAIELLAEVVGARGVPGGVIGIGRSLGFPETGLPAFTPYVGLDGFLGSELSALSPWPLADANKPEKISLQDLIPTAICTSPLHSLTMQNPEKWKVPYNIEFNLCGGVNFLGGKYDPTIDVEAFKNVFQVSFELYLSETTYFSDIVLPDTCFLEATSFSIDRPGYSAAPVGHRKIERGL